MTGRMVGPLCHLSHPLTILYFDSLILSIFVCLTPQFFLKKSQKNGLIS